MTTESSLQRSKVTQRDVVEQLHVHGWTWAGCGAFGGLCLGLVSPIIGSVLTAITWFTGPVWHGFFIERDGTVLLFLTIPLLVIGAHCLDRMDAQAETAREARHS